MDHDNRDLVIPFEILHEMLRYVHQMQASELDYHPALIGPKALILLILSRAQQLQQQQHPAYAQWRAEPDLPLQEKGIRSIFDRSMSTMATFG